jgi:hypothetical protein
MSKSFQKVPEQSLMAVLNFVVNSFQYWRLSMPRPMLKIERSFKLHRVHGVALNNAGIAPRHQAAGRALACILRGAG